MAKTRSALDPELEAIDTLERNIVKAFDENVVHHGTSPEEAERLRPEVVTLAKNVCDDLRKNYYLRGKR